MNISKVINDVVDTVSYKTSNGMVDVKDPYHLYLLKEEFEKEQQIMNNNMNKNSSNSNNNSNIFRKGF